MFGFSHALDFDPFLVIDDFQDVRNCILGLNDFCSPKAANRASPL